MPINLLARTEAAYATALRRAGPRAVPGISAIAGDVRPAEGAGPTLRCSLHYAATRYAVPSFLSFPSLVRSPRTR
jgi:hypothetical protein